MYTYSIVLDAAASGDAPEAAILEESDEMPKKASSDEMLEATSSEEMLEAASSDEMSRVYLPGIPEAALSDVISESSLPEVALSDEASHVIPVTDMPEASREIETKNPLSEEVSCEIPEGDIPLSGGVYMSHAIPEAGVRLSDQVFGEIPKAVMVIHEVPCTYV